MSTERETKTLEQVRDRLRKHASDYGTLSEVSGRVCRECANDIDAHLAREKAEPVARCIDCHEPAPIAVCETCARLRAESVHAATAPAEAHERPLE